MRVHGNDAFVAGSAVVYVYRRTGTQWVEEPILFVSTDGEFGGSLDFDGTTLIVGGDNGALPVPACRRPVAERCDVAPRSGHALLRVECGD